MREGLKAAGMGLGLARLQLQAGLAGDAQATLDQVHQDIQALMRRVEGEGKKGVAELEAFPAACVEAGDDGRECELLTGCLG
jgi:hypothetical protein